MLKRLCVLHCVFVCELVWTLCGLGTPAGDEFSHPIWAATADFFDAKLRARVRRDRAKHLCSAANGLPGARAAFHQAVRPASVFLERLHASGRLRLGAAVRDEPRDQREEDATRWFPKSLPMTFDADVMLKSKLPLWSFDADVMSEPLPLSHEGHCNSASGSPAVVAFALVVNDVSTLNGSSSKNRPMKSSMLG